MRKTAWLVIFCLVLILGILTTARAETVSWSLPTTYVDGSAVTPADQAKIVIHLFSGSAANGPWIEFTKTASGATSWTGRLPAARGVPAFYAITAELNALQSAYSASVGYTVPFVATDTPGSLTIKP